jgi:hypothetical protein
MCVDGDLQGKVWMHEGIDEHTTSSTAWERALQQELAMNSLLREAIVNCGCF